MKKNQEMRPQDIVVLLKVALWENKPWFGKDISFELGISQSEISKSLQRSSFAGLLSADKRIVLKKPFLEFIEHGLKYVYPEKPGAIVRGMNTAHSAMPLRQVIQSDENFVWPWAHGESRGQSVEPLYPGVPMACQKDYKLYELLALVDAIRVGRTREQNIAIQELRNRIISNEE